MEIWSKCDICGRDIPVGELCYGLKKGNCICKDCCTGFENCTFTLAPAPTLTQPNEPLALEQLREMDGRPVYLIVDDGYEPLEMWALIDVPEKDHIVLINNIGGRSAYYSDDDLERDHITVYRRPPERQEDT